MKKNKKGNWNLNLNFKKNVNILIIYKKTNVKFNLIIQLKQKN